jgi:hypothetical protein
LILGKDVLGEALKFSILNTLPRYRFAALAAVVCATLVGSLHATTVPLNVVNGGFETFTSGSTNSQPGYNSTLAGWTNNGYNFVYGPGTADTTGATGSYGTLNLWGPANGSNNGLTPSSPAGGNFMAADGAFQQGSITQQISGLIVGQQASITFYWAGAQQSGFDGLNTEQWEVKLGNAPSQFTSILQNSDHGFTGWQKTTFTFTTTATTETLSFLAHGTPDGVPPFSLLDGVTAVTTTPEPSSFALLFTGVAGFGGLLRKRFTK